MATALTAHLLGVAIVNLFCWTLYFGIKSQYPWPMWVTFGTLLSLAEHVVNIVPWMAQGRWSVPKPGTEGFLALAKRQVARGGAWQHRSGTRRCLKTFYTPSYTVT